MSHLCTFYLLPPRPLPHNQHHMFPMVPYYNLPELHRLLQEGGEMPSP